MALTLNTPATVFVPSRNPKLGIIRSGKYNKDWKYIFWENVRGEITRVVKDVDKIAARECYEVLHKKAPKIVYSVAQQRGFNSWTGALAYAYGAALILDGEHVGNYVMRDDALAGVKPPPSNLKFSRTGRAYSTLQGRRRHTNVAIRQKRTYVFKRKHVRGRKTYTNLIPTRRYLSKIENHNGYRGYYNNSSPVINYIPYRKKTGNKLERNFYLQLYNSAPYAAIVQAGNRNAPGYNVLDNAEVRGRLKYWKKLVRNVAERDIQRALHTYKKDYRSAKKGEAQGKLFRFRDADWD